MAVSGEYSLSMQNSARCVLPVTSTSRCRKTRSTSQGGQVSALGDLLEGDFQFVERVAPPFVHPRGLTGRPDKGAGEQVRQRRMVVPVGDQAAQQIGSAQEGTVRRRRAAQHHMVAAARARVLAVQVEFLGAQTRLTSFFVNRRW